jgi:hypothetical protein
LHNSTIEFPKLLHQPSLEIKRENSKGENFMKSITLDYFFYYTVAWDHPGIQKSDKEVCQDQRQRARLIARVVPKIPIYTIMKVPKVYGTWVRP